MASPLKSYEFAITWTGVSSGELRKWRLKPRTRVQQGVELAVVLSAGKLESIRSTTDGLFQAALVKEGEVCEPGKVLGVLNICKHDVVHGGVCVTCGSQVDHATLSHTALPTGQMASVSVKTELAESRHQELVGRLLQQRKLYLVLDLDLTVLQATIQRPGEEQKFQAYVKAGIDLKTFVLDSHVYWVKFRPGIKEFLNVIADLFDVHVYTLGARMYAESIVKMLDDFIEHPGKKLFRGTLAALCQFGQEKDGYTRIMTRSESREMESKNLKHVLQNGDQIAVIIDDREDVWWQSIANLLPAKPYDFFKGHGDIHDPKKLLAGKEGASDVEKGSDWISPSQQALIAKGKLPKPENYEEKLRLQNEQETERRGVKRQREEDEEEDVVKKSPLASYGASASFEKPSLPPSLPSFPPSSSTVSSGVSSLQRPSATPIIDLKARLKSLPSAKKQKTADFSSETSTTVADESSVITVVPMDIDQELSTPSATFPPISGETVELPPLPPLNLGGKSSAIEATPSDPSIETAEAPATVTPIPPEETVESAQGYPIPEDSDLILFSLTKALQKVHKIFFDEYDATKKLPHIQKAIAEVRQDTFRQCNLTFSHMIPNGVDPRRHRTWARSQFFGAKCELDLVPGKTTHLVCGKAGTDKLRAALKSTHPLFIVDGRWLQDSMDNFERMDETKYQLIDRETDPHQVIPVHVAGGPHIGTFLFAPLGFDKGKERGTNHEEKISLAYSQSVEKLPSPLSSPRLELERDLKEVSMSEQDAEDGNDDGQSPTTINFEDISSDISEEEVNVQGTSAEALDREPVELDPLEEGHEADAQDVEDDGEDEGLDAGFVRSFNEGLLRTLNNQRNLEADDEEVVVEGEPMDIEENIDYGDDDYFEDDA